MRTNNYVQLDSTVLSTVDTEKQSNLTELEYEALIEVMELSNKLYDMELEFVYFRGCYVTVLAILQKAGIL